MAEPQLAFLADAYLTGCFGDDREKVEDVAARATSEVHSRYGVPFGVALHETTKAVDGEAQDRFAHEVHLKSTDAATAAVDHRIACADGSSVTLGWR